MYSLPLSTVGAEAVGGAVEAVGMEKVVVRGGAREVVEDGPAMMVVTIVRVVVEVTVATSGGTEWECESSQGFE